MSGFIGEYDCKVDAKGRVMMPTALRKQVSPEARDRFVVNRGFEKCLVLYPFNEWEKISAEVNNLNQYVAKNREFTRYFFRGASEIALDATGRVLLPKRLLEYAGITNEIILFAYGEKIEVWDAKAYEAMIGSEPHDFSSLAEDVMGKVQQKGGDSVS